MREILFKAKRIDNGEWVEGFFVNATEEYGHGERIAEIIEMDAERTYNGEYTYWKTHVIDINTICQYTGLNDNTKWERLTEEEKQRFYNQACSEDGRTIKYQHIEDVKHLWKGKMIWENDIVKKHFYMDYNAYANSEEYIGIVMFTDCAWVIESKRDNRICTIPIIESMAYSEDVNHFEVIGNIFDNPELLGV